jgi:MFS transporter, DHA3 family, tetracycline resistance protein
LWEAHFLREVGLPSLGSLDSLWWFALLGVGGMVLALLSSNVLVKRVSSGSQATLARTLLVLTVLQAVTMVAFGLATGFALAVATFLAAQLFRSLARPVYSTWLNQSIDDSSLRATVLSISGQSDAIGQVAGGPGIGALGSAFSIRAALVASGLVLTPAVALFARAVRHHGVEPELDELAEPAAVGP